MGAMLGPRPKEAPKKPQEKPRRPQQDTMAAKFVFRQDQSASRESTEAILESERSQHGEALTRVCTPKTH